MNSKFTRPPRKPVDMEAFLNMEDVQYSSRIVEDVNTPLAAPKKQPTQVFNLRLPANMWEQLHAISNKTGITMHAICLNLLHKGLKEYEK